MFPNLIHIGPITIAIFPIFVVVAFFMGLFVMWKRGRELHFEEKSLFDVIISVGIWFLIGSRLGYLLIHAVEIQQNGSWLTALTQLSWFLPTGLLAAYWALSKAVKKLRWDLYQCADVIMTGFILIQAMLAIGSFLTGFGYGIPTNSFIGIQFAGLYDKRYPIQLWEFLGYTLGFVYLWWAESVYRTFPWYRGNKSQASTGFITAMYLIWWGIVNSVATLFRTPSLVYYGFRFDITIPIIFGIIGGSVLLWYRAAGSWQGLRFTVLEYFGLNKKIISRSNKT